MLFGTSPIASLKVIELHLQLLDVPRNKKLAAIFSPRMVSGENMADLSQPGDMLWNRIEAMRGHTVSPGDAYHLALLQP